MSYTRTFNGSIEVSGTIAVSYPASEHGGTVYESYSQTVPVVMNVYVDTSPFDSSIHGAKNRIDVLTGSIIAMEASQCETVKDNAMKISKSIIDGFYGMINSEISTQKAENNSIVQSKFALLMEYAKDVVDKHQRMEDDLGRLHSHYGAIFDGINEDLYKRIKSLDKQVFYLADEVRTKLINDSLKNQGAFGFFQIKEQTQSVGMITMARLTKKISEVLDTMSNTVQKTVSYKKSSSDMLWDDEIWENMEEYIPVVYCGAKATDDSGTKQMNIYSPNIKEKVRIEESVKINIMGNENDKWEHVSASDIRFIDQAFSHMVETKSTIGDTDSKDIRIYREMLKMWHNDREKIINLCENKI